MSAIQPADDRKICVLALSCVGRAYQYLLNLSDDFNRRFRIVPFIFDRAKDVTEVIQIPDDIAAGCDVLICHGPGWGDWGENQAYANLAAGFPQEARIITVPLGTVNWLWPFHAYEPRNDDPERPLNRHGELPRYPYGDAFVLGKLKQGVAKDEIFKQYMAADVSDYVDLDGLGKICLEQQASVEAQTDVKFLEFVVSEFRAKQVYQSINHPSNATLIHMTNQILAKLDISPLSRYAHEAIVELLPVQVPVHPSVIRYFNLRWVTPETRFAVDSRRRLNFAEYIHQYIHFA